MTMRVIDVLEVVEVDVHQSKVVSFFIALGELKLLLIGLHEITTIWQFCQLVM